MDTSFSFLIEVSAMWQNQNIPGLYYNLDIEGRINFA